MRIVSVSKNSFELDSKTHTMHAPSFESLSADHALQLHVRPTLISFYHAQMTPSREMTYLMSGSADLDDAFHVSELDLLCPGRLMAWGL